MEKRNQTFYTSDREDDDCLFKCKSTLNFQGVFRQFEVIFYVGDKMGEKEKTLPKVSPFIVWSL